MIVLCDCWNIARGIADLSMIFSIFPQQEITRPQQNSSRGKNVSTAC